MTEPILSDVDDGGWPLSPILLWLARDGRRLTEAAELVRALGERLAVAGAPVWRLRMSQRTLHPQITSFQATWLRGEADPVTTQRAAHGLESRPAYVGSPLQQVQERGEAVRRDLRALTADDHPVLHEIAALGGTDYLAVPVRFSTGEIASLGFATDRPEGFTDRDIDKLFLLTDFIAPVQQLMVTRAIASGLLETYVGRRAGRRVLEGQVQRGDVERIEAALMYTDLRDFTGMSERMAPEVMLDLLNLYYEALAGAAEPHGGEVLRFIGDAVLIVFPVADAGPDAACRAALAAAQGAVDRIAALNADAAAAAPIRFGVGLHLGQVSYGNVGSPERLDFTVIGAAVNRTARLETLTKTVDRQILMSAEFAARIDRPAQPLGAHPVPGVPEPLEVFGLDD